MSLWSDYFKEQENYKTIEREDGFISYLINGKECLIAHMYSIPEIRGTMRAVALADEVAELAKKEYGCTHLSCAVFSKHASATHNVRIFIKYGFKIVGCTNSHILMTKDLGGENV
jgi:hypothetical protein